MADTGTESVSGHPQNVWRFAGQSVRIEASELDLDPAQSQLQQLRQRQPQ